MKIKNAICYILKATNITLCIISFLMVIGTIGAFEVDNISFMQFCIQELFACLGFLLVYVLYIIRLNIECKHVRRHVKRGK